MSMFIGTDNSGKKVLHITNGVHDLATMKSGVISSTVFHNDMQFNSYKIVDVSSFKYAYSSGGSAPSPVRYLDGVYRTANYFLIAHCDTATIQAYAAIAGASFHLLNSSYAKVNTPYNFGFTNPFSRGSWNGNVTYSTANTYVTSSYTLPCFGVYKYRNASAPAISDSGFRHLLIIYTPSNQSLGTGVKISTNTIQIGNKDLKNFQYVYSGTVNSHPQCLQITPYIQLVDSSKISGSLEIVSNPGKTTISVGGYNIIATDSAYYNITGGVTVSVSTSSVYYPTRYYNIAALSGNIMYVIIYHSGLEIFKGYINNYSNYAALVYAGASPYYNRVILQTDGTHLRFSCSLGSAYGSTVYADFVVYYKYL